MDDLIDQEFEAAIPSPAGPATGASAPGDRLFTKAAAASVFLHLLLAAAAMVPGGHGVPGTTATYVDLSALEAPSPPASLPSEAPAEPLATEPPESVPAEEAAPLPPTAAEDLARDVGKKISKAEESPEALHEASLALGLSSGMFNSLNEGKTLKGEIREYYFTMLRRINECWWMLGGAQGTAPRRDTQLIIVVSPEGKILDRSVAVSSGDPLYDRKVLQAVDLASPLPPLPEGYPMPFFEAPLRVVKPLSLFNFGGNS